VKVTVAAVIAAAALTTSCTANPGPRPAAAPAASVVPGHVTELATGLRMPWGLTFLPDSSALVSSRDTGEIHRISPDGRSVDLVGVVADVPQTAEGGLLGLASSPDFGTDRTVFAYVSGEPSNRVVPLRFDDEVSAFTVGAPIIEGIATDNRHHGGRLTFDQEGNLWVGTGDAFNGSYAQDPASLNGKVLRVRRDGSPADGNPFNTAVFSIGHRNVQGIAFGPDGTVYASEFGHRTWDEVNVLRPGGNYGWPVAEGADRAFGEKPMVTVHPDDASPSGLAYAHGSLWMAGLRGQRLWQIPVGAGGVAGDPIAHFNGRWGRLRTVELAPDGSLWLLTSNSDEATWGGTDPRPGDDRLLRVVLEEA
jgi:glucose/arabinose dehydrogenase